MGEWNIKEEKDCDENRYCAPPVQDITIEKIIQHEDFYLNETYIENDIALIRLSREVEFDDIVKPVCIPDPVESKAYNYEGERLFVAGWGKSKRRKI